MLCSSCKGGLQRYSKSGETCCFGFLEHRASRVRETNGLEALPQVTLDAGCVSARWRDFRTFGRLPVGKVTDVPAR